MLKRVAVFVMMFASLGAIVPATAAAAERGRVEKQVIVQKKVVHRRGRLTTHRVIARRAPAHKVVIVKRG
jgi:hypothetical protein